MIMVVTSMVLAVTGLAAMMRGGVPGSISGLVYNLGRSRRWLWSAWLAAVAVTLMVPLMSALGDAAWLGWLTVACLIGAAVTPICNGETRLLHNVCGVVAGVVSQVCVACLCPWWLLAWTVWPPFLAGAMAALNDAEDMPRLVGGHSVFAAECTCVVSLFGCLMFSV